MLRPQIFEGSEKLRFLQMEVTDFATELIARYQPVARDLRFIQSFMDAAYGFSRFGRYAYDIAEVLETIGPFPNCDKSPGYYDGKDSKRDDRTKRNISRKT